LFSPVKIYLLTIFIFYLDIFVTEYRAEICALYLGFLAIAIVLCRKEHGVPISTSPVSLRLGSESGAIGFLCLFTIFPVASMAVLILYFGSVSSYLEQLPVRSLTLRGLNTFSEIGTNIAALITLIYFGIGLTRKRRWRWWMLYIVHFGIAFAIVASSGSRRSLLMMIIAMIGLWNYLRAPILLRTAAVSLAILLFVASVGAVLRLNQRDFTSLGKELSHDEEVSVTAHFKYGLMPFEIILDSNVIELHYGSTFVAAITNIIPRPLWPEKPDGAGPAFTKDYLGDKWLGASNYNANLIVESIMNFGFVVGIPFGFAVLAGALMAIVRRYRVVMASVRSARRPGHAVFTLIRHFQIVLAVAGLVNWETAVVSVPLVLNLIALWGIELRLTRLPDARRTRFAGRPGNISSPALTL
jgi:oligosaccharide repeat unit polymerase